MAQETLHAEFSAAMTKLDDTDNEFVPALVDLLLGQARNSRASDIHLVPTENRLLMQWRIDGVLHSVAGFDGEIRPRIVARLKVLAGLLTYRTDVPQEGRISTCSSINDETDGGEVRVTTFPTLFGEKAAIRLFANSDHFQLLPDLGLPNDIEHSLRSLLQETSGVVLLTGPSGSGKTTTVYACLREIVQQYDDTKGVMTLEDPIEVVVSGVTQSQVQPNVGFDLSVGLKSMMRQDPDVIMVGEIRDPATAESAFQAALTGHLVITTFHAGSSAEAITRLLDMGIEPYLLRSTLQAVVCQRLLRKACSECASADESATDSTKSENFRQSVDNSSAGETLVRSCPLCGGLGYHGRFVTAELLDPNVPEVARGMLERVDSRSLQAIAKEAGTVTLKERGQQAVTAGLTTAEEVFRVLGR